MTPTAATAPLAVETPFGAFAADTRSVVTFPSGLPGFERCRRFVLVEAPSLAPFLCLHGLDAPQPSFLTLDPRSVVPGYAPELSARDRARLGAADPGAPLVWLAIVRLDADGATLNLDAPIVVDPRRMVGVQLLDAGGPFAGEHRVGIA